MGTELRSRRSAVTDGLRRRLAERDCAAEFEPSTADRLLESLIAAAEEFACIVEDRVLPSPHAEVSISAAMGDPAMIDLPTAARLHLLDEALGTVREVIRAQWRCLPHGRLHAQRVDAALDRYIARLRERITSEVRAHPACARAAHPCPDDVLSDAERRWGGTQTALCVVVYDPPPPNGTAAPAEPAEPSVVGRQTVDHLLAIEEHRPPGTRPSGTRSGSRPTPTTVIAVGPVAADEVAAAYKTALLRYRLVRAGVSASPPPRLLPLPNLGFLHADPSETTVVQIAELLGPLMEQSEKRRITLATTFLCSVRKGGSRRAVAKRLGIHEGSVVNHLDKMRKLYGFLDGDDGGSTILLQAALHLVLPLWELDGGGRRPR
ncbi:hypothetical protein FXB39_01585 [Nocardioides sp. BGMRC 2183]|nr:hypothetical protein FXB39_01585 [Nocardioides sp. BGMRC 2183]